MSQEVLLIVGRFMVCDHSVEPAVLMCFVGLWPDKSVHRPIHVADHRLPSSLNSCDGTYNENCDPSRAHYNIREAR